ERTGTGVHHRRPEGARDAAGGGPDGAQPPGRRHRPARTDPARDLRADPGVAGAQRPALVPPPGDAGARRGGRGRPRRRPCQPHAHGGRSAGAARRSQDAGAADPASPTPDAAARL
ncbi:MAG: hypothetical protein AVDCRST_MAG40-2186, partial [uncultured Gemmatimonadaceae bacterium]